MVVTAKVPPGLAGLARLGADNCPEDAISLIDD
jgi:ferredoxin